jgi:hypothetical protein
LALGRLLVAGTRSDLLQTRALEELGNSVFAAGAPPLPQWWNEEKNLRTVAQRRAKRDAQR